MTTFPLTRLALILALALLSALPAKAQNLFAPVAQVNERVITVFERDQRARMLALFNTPGDPLEEALNSLIDERLQLEVASARASASPPRRLPRG